MSVRDEGATHYFGDDCPGGHRAAGVAGVDWDDQETADEANAREAAEQEFADLALAARDKHVFANITTCVCGFQPPMSRDWERHRMEAALAAVVPLIRAQVAAEHDAPAPIDGLRPKVSQALAATARVDLIWVDPPRVEPRPPVITPAVPGTFAAPVTYREDFSEPDEPVADMQAAFEAGEKGVTKRPVSNREFIAAEVERLGLKPKVDAMWAEIENAPPPPPGWCTWHQRHVAECAGDTDECREAKAELNEPNGDTP